MGSSQGERRAHPRRRVQFEIEGAARGRSTLARMTAQDLSLGGLHCRSDVDFPEMTRLAVRLLLPSPNDGHLHPVDLEAVVVRRRAVNRGATRHYELALYFTHLSADARERLARFVGAA